MMKVVIIGGEGFVGSAYGRWCRANNIDYLVVNRNNYDSYVGTEADIVINANGNSKKFVARETPLVDFDASVRSVRQSLLDFPSQTYVFLSSCDVYPDCSTPEITQEDSIIKINSQSPYGFHKYLAEQCVQHCHHNWLIFRMGGFVGKNLSKNAIYDILKGEQLWLHPQSELQYINTDVACDRVMEIISKGYRREIFNLCGNGLVKLQEIIDVTGRNIAVNNDILPVRYEVSINKIQQVVDIPPTRETVMEFVSQFI